MTTISIPGVPLHSGATMQQLFPTPTPRSGGRDPLLFSGTPLSNILGSNEVEFDTIPPIFTNRETWPQFLRLHCHHCTLQIEGIPIPIPDSMDYDLDCCCIYRISSVVCSFECAMGLIGSKNTIPPVEYELRVHLLQLIANMFGVAQLPFKAPPHTELRMYGGPLSVERYRAKVTQIYPSG